MPASPTSTNDPSDGTRTYRAFRLTPNGRVDGLEIIKARSDDEAKMIAAQMVNGHGIDLWERDRFLESFPPLSASARTPNV